MLGHNRLEAGDIMRLMGCPGLRALRHLSLRNNACGDEEIRELGNSPNLSSMETLGLREVGGTTRARGVVGFRQAPFVEALTLV